MIQCRVDSGMTDRADTRKWDDHDWMEWQANHLSAAVLMPKSAVDLVVRPFRESSRTLYLVPFWWQICPTALTFLSRQRQTGSKTSAT